MQTQIVTLTANYPASASYTLSSNQVVKIDTAFYTPINSNNGLTIKVAPVGLGGSISFVNMVDAPFVAYPYPATFTGLTNITISPTGSGAVTLTVLTPSTNTTTYTPANSVVIPSDATGPVQIILQSSSDLVNWVPSMPGTYGNTYSNRFFRVIAVAQ